ncbi:MAG: hypothetical protein RLZZ237_776, partial [Pseudomonadota bacterium]
MLVACGGGSGDAKPAENPVVVSPFVNAQPTANAGADQYVLAGTTVTLDGGASSDGNGDALTYKWSLVSKPVGSAAALATNSNVRSVFIADVAGEYVATLVVNDGKIDSLPENITIVAVSNTGVGTSNLVANGGPNQNVSVKSTVNLDGSSSTDSKGRTLSYNWTLIAKPTGSEAIISSSAGKKATFIADAAGLYSVLFYVAAGNEKSLPVTIFINASANGVGVNLAPLANAGPDQSALTGSLITLDGGLSTDPNGDLLSYRWSMDSKPALSAATLLNPTSKISRFTADVAGTYELGLIVNDGKLDSKKDVINVVVRLPGVVNIPDTGRYRCSDISKDLALILFAQGHTYLDRDHDGKPCEA